METEISFSAHRLISWGFTLNWSMIECIESFDDVMKDAIKIATCWGHAEWFGYL